MRKNNGILSLALAATMAVLPWSNTAMAGQSDISLFAGGDGLAPNIAIILDSSGSMGDPPSGGGTDSKKTIAIRALQTLIVGVNPLISGTTYEENARFGLFTFKSDGGLMRQAITSNNTQSVLNAIGSHATTGVGTPLSASTLDVARYFAANEAWGTLATWGSRGTTEPAVTNPFDFSCRQTFAVMITDGDPRRDGIAVAGFWDTIGDYDGDGGTGENGAETLANVGTDDVEWTDDITKAMFERDFNTSIEGTQNVTTHVIGFDTNGDNLQRMADNGGGLYRTATSSAALVSVLSEVADAAFDSLASYSTAVVPTSRTAYGSSFYNAYFIPDEDDAFWEGRIEAYDISADGQILDQAGNAAVDAAFEFVDPPNPHWDAGLLLRSDTGRDIYTTIANGRVDFTNSVAMTAGSRSKSPGTTMGSRRCTLR